MSPQGSSSVSVSVVLPTYNRLRYLRDAIGSVFAQTFTDWELVIADDGSEEETCHYLSRLAGDPRLQILFLPHTGNPAAARNLALRRARGHYVAFLDSDDVWLPEKLARQVAALRADAAARWNYCAVRRIGADGAVMEADTKRVFVAHCGAIFRQILTLEASIATPAVLAERALIEQAGAFDEQQPHFEDYDLWLRLIRLSDVGVVAEPLVCVRSHDQHYTADRIAVYQARSRLLDKHRPFAQGASLRRAWAGERARNDICLARAYARAGRRTQALRTLWRGRREILRTRAGIWQPAGETVLLALSPPWLRALARQLRRHRGAMLAG